jgi:hypothetical protein
VKRVAVSLGNCQRQPGTVLGVQQVDDSVPDETVTHKNAALVEESSASLASVDQQAEQLLDVIAFFKTSGRASVKPPPGPNATAAEAPVAGVCVVETPVPPGWPRGAGPQKNSPAKHRVGPSSYKKYSHGRATLIRSVPSLSSPAADREVAGSIMSATASSAH